MDSSSLNSNAVGFGLFNVNILRFVSIQFQLLDFMNYNDNLTRDKKG